MQISNFTAKGHARVYNSLLLISNLYFTMLKVYVYGWMNWFLRTM